MYSILQKLLITIYTLSLVLFWGTFKGNAQKYDTIHVLDLPVILDEVVVKSGFDVEAFIRRMKTDTTFYKEFKSMHLVPYKATNDIKILDNTGKVTATLYSHTMQHIKNNCRYTTTNDEKTTGNFYKKNGDYNYYTAELYDYLFFSKKMVCNQSDIVANSIGEKGRGQMEKNKYELKQLIFNPGSKISGIPLMGNRASIFDEEEKKKYNFKIIQDSLAGMPCYVFSITPKPAFTHKVVYNELTTWFRKEDYRILARLYSISFSTLFYDFDVTMKVVTCKSGNKLLPAYIEYNGNWHILTKKRERVTFVTKIDY